MFNRRFFMRAAPAVPIAAGAMLAAAPAAASRGRDSSHSARSRSSTASAGAAPSAAATGHSSSSAAAGKAPATPPARAAFRCATSARREAARIVEGMRNGDWEEDPEARRMGICPEELYAGEDPADVWHEAAPEGCRAFAELLAAARVAGAAISEADEAGAYAAALSGRLVFDVARRVSDILEEGW